MDTLHCIMEYYELLYKNTFSDYDSYLFRDILSLMQTFEPPNN